METVSFIGLCGEKYLVQVRDVRCAEFADGIYPFVFPGACGLFGGEKERGEEPLDAMKRELAEELPGFKFDLSNDPRTYNWKRDLGNVLKRINDVFGGNLRAFLGFDLDSNVPAEALGNQRGSSFTYLEYIQSRKEREYAYPGTFDRRSLARARVAEGKGYELLKPSIVKSLVMVPTDKILVLDDIAIRAERGEIEI